MIALKISAMERRDVIDAKAKTAMEQVTFPLEVTLKNETGRALILPEVGLKIGAAEQQILTLESSRRFSRLVSNLAQVAHLVKVSPLATLTFAATDSPAAKPAVKPAAKADEPSKPTPEPEPAALADQVRVVRDDDEAFVVELDGIQFEPQRNQVREDGTLTPGGKRALAEAKAKSQQRAN